MRKAEITVHLFQETRHIMPDRPEYLYGKKMYGADKDVIISFLKQAP